MMRIANVSGGRIAIETPYNPEFVERVKVMGGRWDREERVWVVDERNTEAVRQAMREVYGRDDRPTTLVSVRVKTTQSFYALRGPVKLFGRVVASAWGRDSGARIGDNVAFTRGQPESGGSVKNWRTVIPEDCVIVIHDVPKAAVAEELNWNGTYGTYEILEPDTVDRKALEEERAALLARLAEIDDLLA